MFCPLCGKHSNEKRANELNKYYARLGVSVFCEDHGHILFRIIGDGRTENIRKTEEIEKAINLILFDGLTETQISRALLYYRDGKTIHEIAAQFGVANEGVRQSIIQAKKKLLLNYAKYIGDNQ